MSDWKKVAEEGGVIHINEEVGNVVETADGKYICMIPKVFTLGPFDSLDVAKAFAEDKDSLNKNLETFNLHLIGLAKQLKSE